MPLKFIEPEGRAKANKLWTLMSYAARESESVMKESRDRVYVILLTFTPDFEPISFSNGTELDNH